MGHLRVIAKRNDVFDYFTNVSAAGDGVCLQATQYKPHITNSWHVRTVDRKLPHYVLQ
jgi:hypothetical protein